MGVTEAELLGLPLSEAEKLLRAAGVEPVIIVTRAPRDERTGGELRVIRVRGQELTASAFHTQVNDTQG